MTVTKRRLSRIYRSFLQPELSKSDFFFEIFELSFEKITHMFRKKRMTIGESN